MTRAWILFLGLLTVLPGLVSAQAIDTIPEVPAPATGSPHVIRLYHVAAAAAGLTLLMMLDQPVQRYAIDNSGSGADNVASTVRHYGQPEVYGTVTLGLLAAGLASGNSSITRSGGRLAASLLLAGVTTEIGKQMLGRPRPEQSLDSDGFVPFSGQVSLPSGHTAMSFALATSLADDIHRPLASIGLYGLATAVGWSRINDNRHWLSDVAAGALVGVTSAKLVSGRWRIFGLKPPAFLVAPGMAGLNWHAQF
jgi:membrane-associated phospholipid phosphatase